MICKEEHRYWDFLRQLPDEQGTEGRHRCCGCAYEKGYRAGLTLENNLALDLDTLHFSQAGAVRHKSAHAAFAQGYIDGVEQHYNEM